ncbi:DNA translocase FtsK 4TM domain-containing protein, partial [Providencia rustigianii]
MSQEYTEDKYIKFKKLSSGRRLLEVILLAICLSAIFLMVALLSFSPSDPSWSQTTWDAPVKNLGGSIGSWSADILFSAFGILAFAIPPILLLGCWAIYHYESQRRYIDFFSLSLRLIGGLALILSSCGLAALNFDDLPNFASGGVIGSVFSNAIMPWFNSLGATLALLFLWAISFTLFTGWSWLTIAEKLGAGILLPITLLTNRARGDDLDEYDYDVEETEDALQRAQQAEHQANHDAQSIDMDDVLFSAPTVAELVHDDIEPQVEKQPLAQDVQAVTPSIHQSQPTSFVVQPMDDEPLPTFSATDEPQTYHFNAPEDEQSQVDNQYQQPAVSQNQYEERAAYNEIKEPSVFTPQDELTHFNSQPYNQQPQVTPTAPVIAKPEASQTFTPSFTSPATPSTPAVGMEVSDLGKPLVSEVSDRVANSAALAAAGISIAAMDRHAQVKKNMEPELPRPNPVRLPTRRELYGIRIPSLRDAELQRRQEEASQREQTYQQQTSAEEPGNEEVKTDEELDQERLLSLQFMEQQRQRYGEIDSDDHSLETPPHSVQAEPQPEIPQVYTSSYTQPNIEHRWPSASESDEITVAPAAYSQPSNIHHFTAHVDDEPTLESEYDDLEPKIDLSSSFSVLEDFSPVDDLIDDEPTTPIFMPSFTAPPVSIPPEAPVNNFNVANTSEPAQTFAQP